MSKSYFFLGANSPSGFYSLYDGFTSPEKGDMLYILKGGPGCGKSSFMRKIGEAMCDDGLDVEFIRCSGDPDSLDAIYIPALKTGYVDGTAPHVVEPTYPAMSEQYINLGEFYDCNALRNRFDETAAIKKEYGKIYSRAYEFISAAGAISQSVCDSLFTEHLERALKKRATGIADREFKKAVGRGKVTNRFLNALTCKGEMCLYDTADVLCDRCYLLDNELGFAPYMLASLAGIACGRGWDIIVCRDPMQPDKMLHMLIPELSLSFLTQDSVNVYNGKVYRHLRVDAMVEHKLYAGQKAKIKVCKKLINGLTQEACREMSEAKKLHDEMEKIYNPHVNFDEVYTLAQKHIELLRKEK